MKNILSHFKNNLKSWKIYALCLIFILPIIFHFSLIFKYGLNIPFWDDFHTVFLFLIKYLDSGTLFEKLQLIFAQHTEHRFALNKIITLFNFYLGYVDFKLLMILGNLALIGVLIILYNSTTLKKNRLFLLMPIPFLLFQTQYHESIYWATAALANFYILFFSFMSLFLINKNKTIYFYLSIIFALFATFTMGNGMFVFPIVLAILIYQKHYRKAMIWFLVTIALFAFYFHNYINPAGHPSLFQSFINPLNTLNYFFTFLGTPLGLIHPLLHTFSKFLGFFVVLYFVFLTYKSYFKKNIVVYSFFLFLLISAFLIAFARSGFGLEQAYASKYAIVTILFYILIYISFIEIFPTMQKNKFIYIFLFFSMTFNIISFYSNIKDIKSHRDSLIEGMEQWQNSNPLHLQFPDKESANKFLLEAIEKNIYMNN